MAQEITMPSTCCKTISTNDAFKYFTSSSYALNVLQELNELRKSERFCDVEITTEGKHIKAHRAILSASSPYFHAMFTGGLAEEQQDTVVLQGISAQVFTTLLGFIYTGSIYISQSNVQQLMSAADMLGLADVVSSCTQYLKDELHSSNALGIYRFAEGHNCSELASVALSYIYSHFTEVSGEEEFLDLPKDMLIRLLESEMLCVDNEAQVLLAALKWVAHNVIERRRFVFEVLLPIRLSLVSFSVLEKATFECVDLSLKVALQSIQRDLAAKRGSLVPLGVQPRRCAKKTIYVIGGSKRELSCAWTRPSECTYSEVECYDTFRDEWKQVSPMKIGRILPGIAVWDGLVFVVGGEQESQIMANGEVYSPLDNTWMDMPSMVVPRCEFGLCAVSGFLYALGGWVGEDIGDSIERYDHGDKTWGVIGKMPEPKFSMGVVVYEDMIYVVGGCTHNRRHLQELVSFNPLIFEWTQLAPMLVPRSQMGVTVLGKHLYVVGGTNRHKEVLHSVERYSFEENTWCEVPPMTVGRASPAVASADGKLFVIGGDQTHEVNFYRAQVTIDSVEFYDPETNQWNTCSKLPESRSEAGAVVI